MFRALRRLRLEETKRIMSPKCARKVSGLLRNGALIGDSNLRSGNEIEKRSEGGELRLVPRQMQSFFTPFCNCMKKDMSDLSIVSANK